MSKQLGDAPIDPELHKLMNALAHGIHELLNGKPPTTNTNGFILMIFPFEDHEGRCNYISNAQREDVVTMLKEQVARFEGQAEMKGNA